MRATGDFALRNGALLEPDEQRRGRGAQQSLEISARPQVSGNPFLPSGVLNFGGFVLSNSGMTSLYLLILLMCFTIVLPKVRDGLAGTDLRKVSG
jgi:hypothetical protein